MRNRGKTAHLSRHQAFALFALSLLCLANGTSTVWAQDISTTPIVVAQNEEPKKGGFFGIFNSSKKERRAAPLFLDKRPHDGFQKATPYNYGATSRGPQIPDNDIWAVFKARQEMDIVSRMTEAQIAVDQAAHKREQAVRLAFEQRVENGAMSIAPKTKKKQVYDPHTVWSYNPNESKDGKTPKRIYNSTR